MKIWVACLVLIALAVLVPRQVSLFLLNSKLKDTERALKIQRPPGPIVGKDRKDSKSVDRVATSSKIDENRVDEVSRKLNEMLATLPKGAAGERAVFKQIPLMLEAVKGLNVAEMLAVSQRLDISDANRRGSTLFLALLYVVAQVDPQAVLESPHSSEMLRMEGDMVAMGALAERDVDQAEGFLNSDSFANRYSNEWAPRMLRQLVEAALLVKDPQRGLDLIKASATQYDSVMISPTDAQFTLTQSQVLAKLLANEDLEGALSGVANEVLKSSLYAGGVSGLKETLEMLYPGDEMAAQRFAALESESGFSVATIIKTPEVADEFFSYARGLSADEKPDLTSLTTELVSHWMQTDFNAAGEWISSLEPSKEREMAISTFASNIRMTDPQTAIEWYQSLEDQKTAHEKVKEVVEQWYERSPGDAQAWVKERGFEVGLSRYEVLPSELNDSTESGDE